MKLYVLEKENFNADGERLVVVKVFKSMPRRFSYLIWI